MTYWSYRLQALVSIVYFAVFYKWFMIWNAIFAARNVLFPFCQKYVNAFLYESIHISELGLSVLFDSHETLYQGV